MSLLSFSLFPVPSSLFPVFNWTHLAVLIIGIVLGNLRGMVEIVFAIPAVARWEGEEETAWHLPPGDIKKIAVAAADEIEARRKVPQEKRL